MKTSSVLASVLFGSFAVAAPFDKRALVYKTEVVTETVVVYTTVYDDDEPAQATTSLISSSSSVVNITTSADAPAYTAPAPVPAPETSSSSVYVAPPQAPAPAPTTTYVAPPQAPAPTPTPAPVETPEPAPVPVPAPSSTYVEPAPPAYSAPPAAPEPAPSAVPVPPSNGGGNGAGQYSAEITIYDLPKKPAEGDYGACGTKLNEEDMVVALSAGLMGASTYELATGKATNKWCGQWIEIFYQGNSIKAQIQDKCPGCTHDSDIDLSYSAWKALTGTEKKERYVGSWSPVAA